MFADDRVLVGVIKRKKDFEIAQGQSWYRIPQSQLPRGLNAEYIAFFLSGKTFRDRSGSIAYFARITGLELARRRDLLPDEDLTGGRDLLQGPIPRTGSERPADQESAGPFDQLREDDLGSLHQRREHRRAL